MPPRLPDEIRRQVIAAYAKFKTAAETGRQFGIGHSSVLRILDEAGIERGTPMQVHPHRLTPAQEDEVVQRYRAGELSGAIARDMDCSVFLVRKLARRAGCLIRGRGNRVRDFSEAQVAEMKHRWLAGESQRSIGDRLGVAQGTISAVLRRYDIAKEHRRAKGEKHGQWKGGRHVVDGGYVWVMVPADHRFATMRNRLGYIPEHRLVMAQKLGRPLSPRETVHHINGVRDDNRPENLELWASRHPRGERVTAKHCPTCTCGEHA